MFDENFDNGRENSRLNFGEDPDNHLDPGIFKRIFSITLISRIGSIGPWRFFDLSE